MCQGEGGTKYQEVLFLLKYIILTHSNKKTSSIIIGISIIFALIFGIIFLIKLSPQKNSPVRVDPRVDPSQNIQIFGKNTPEYIDLSKYKNDKGQIKNVDTTIKSSKDKDYKYANTTNNFQTYFGHDIKIQKNNSSITFQILTNLTINDQNQSSNLNFNNSLTTSSTDGQKNRIVYSDVYKKDNANIDVAYNVQNDKLSEEMILNKNLGSLKISQNLNLNNVFAKVENNQISFYNSSTKQRLWFIPQPKMYEQKNQKETNTGLHYELTCQDSSKKIEKCSQLTLTKIIDKNGKTWLSDPKRQYPIVIDPDFQIDNADTAANWVSSDATNFTVSQEVGITKEGTGSVKIIAAGTANCWGIGGSCDAGCSYASYSSGSVNSGCGGANLCSGTNCYASGGSCCGTVYSSYSSGSVNSTCGGGSACGGACWGISGSCDGGCAYTNYTSGNWNKTCNGPYTCSGTDCYANGGSCCGTVYANVHLNSNVNFSCSVCDKRSGYWFDGSCSSGSPATCYHYDTAYSVYGTAACPPLPSCSATGTLATSYISCSWVAAQHYYTASNPQSSYCCFYGSCDGGGSGNCYKTNGSATQDWLSNSCDSSGCYDYGDSYTSAPTSCSWIAQKYSYTAGTPVTGYWGFSGSCSSGSPATCYQINGGTSTDYTSGGCGSGGCSTGSDYRSAPTSCTWASAQYSYTAGTPVTGYWGFGGSCTDNSPPCYKINGGTSTNYTSGGCGSSGCSTGSDYRSAPTSCDWITNSSLNDTATITKGATNLANSKSITFWVRSTRTGSFMRFQMGEAASTEQTYAFTISSANTWEQKTWDITGIASGSRDAITKFAFQNTDASSGFTFYFDDIQALAAAPNDPSVCVIRESPTDTYLIPQWVDSSSDEDGFQLEKNTNGGGFSFLTNLGAGITGYTDNSISSGNTYAYRVRSYKAGVGSTDFSNYCTHPTLDLHTGSLKLDGVKMNGLKIN